MMGLVSSGLAAPGQVGDVVTPMSAVNGLMLPSVSVGIQTEAMALCHSPEEPPSFNFDRPQFSGLSAGASLCSMCFPPSSPGVPSVTSASSSTL